MTSGITKKRVFRIIILTLFLLGGVSVVVYKLYELQITQFKYYQAQAKQQQTADIVISPARGTIYDRNMIPLAESTPVNRVFISPVDIKDDEQAKLIAENLSRILDVDYDFVYEKTQKKNRRDETIKKNVELEQANEVREFKLQHGITAAIVLADETKRTYPNSNFAAHILGFTGTDNNGLLGIELQYNELLKGIPGRIITGKNARNNPMPIDYESYIEPQNGYNLVLTIDWSLQSFLEKYLESALAESQAKERVTGIVMDTDTGEILAMATKPDFDPNNPFVLNDYLQEIFDSMTFASTEEQTKAKSDLLNMMWKNKAITEPYEPGSTFKLITAAIGLEEKAVSINDKFTCTGVHIVGGASIRCHLTGGHGTVSFAEGLAQSCNPAIMKTAEKIGGETFLKYFDAFGYNEKTGIDLPGEAGGITHNPKNFRSVELATSSFGQTFKITPIRQITGICTIANGGKVVVPHIVKAITDDSGNIIKSIGTTVKRTVMSEDTCKTIADILADGVANGGAAKNAFVKGYNIAAKTGTSQKRDSADESARIGSCVAFAPAENPKIAILIVVDEPQVGSIYGGVNSAPFVSKFMADALPYLGFEPKYAEQEQIKIPDYTNKDVKSVIDDIKAKGLSYTIEGNGDYVKAQIPMVGSILQKNGSVILYTDSSEGTIYVKTPSVINLTAEKANKKIVDAGLNINIIGAENMNSSAVAIKQSPEAGESVPIGTIVTVEFRHYEGVH